MLLDEGATIFTDCMVCKKRFAALTSVIVAFFLMLGFWQLKRAEEKSLMIKAYEQAMNRPGQPLMPPYHPLQYEKIAVKGHYLSYYFLLDNQQQTGHFGYDVITPFVMKDGSIILIDRGFVIAPGTREILPDMGISPPNDFMSVQGVAYYPKKVMRLGSLVEKQRASCMVIEAVDIPFISGVLHKSVYPFIMRLGNDEPYGFSRQWPLVSVLPARHVAYAVQWFAMAIVLLGIFIGLCIKKRK